MSMGRIQVRISELKFVANNVCVMLAVYTMCIASIELSTTNSERSGYITNSYARSS